MKLRFFDYLRAAFNARPMGMWIPPNWIGVAAFAMGGLLNPAIWLFGAAAELSYLLLLASSARFQRVVDATKLPGLDPAKIQSARDRLARLSDRDRTRYNALEHRCQTIIERQGPDVSSEAIAAQGQGLGRLLGIYLRLLLMRSAIEKTLEESDGNVRLGESIEDRIRKLTIQIKSDKITDDLRNSLRGQLDILEQRRERQREARTKLEFLEAELTRVEEQVELIREQAVLLANPEAVSNRIDEIAATLGGTTQWIQEQQQIYGRVEDMLNDPPPVTVRPRQKESA